VGWYVDSSLIDNLEPRSCYIYLTFNLIILAAVKENHAKVYLSRVNIRTMCHACESISSRDEQVHLGNLTYRFLRIVSFPGYVSFAKPVKSKPSAETVVSGFICDDLET
jgi:hypothetical protein